ncbi:nematocyst expressed protein 6 [Folsomia candida]|uniref:Metalloendopeptidase n=1 Tax=Folsomia candida TaxID=158441 RepID=A0A226D618_FOLCA|nr:nematocyst expressed protein 6 [Folsomia candida]OXA40540.1 Nematocyte expressed protein 6 [Folsomia candida]
MGHVKLQQIIFLLLFFIREDFGAPSSSQDAEGSGADPVLFVRDDFNDTKKYLVIDDMVLTKDLNKAGLINHAWPNAIVPYTFALTIIPQQKAMITSAIAELSTRTCLQFRPAKKDDAYWLLFQNDPMNQGCTSYVGWQNRKNQQVQLSTNCAKGNAIHEIIHAVGFYHEHTRNDRDEYIVVNYANVNPGQENNFRKENELDPPPETSVFDHPYNYDSIMHYGTNYFSKNGAKTVEPLNHPGASGKGDNIGQREYLSQGDVDMLNKKYDCPTLANVEDGLQSTKPPAPINANPVCNFSPQLPICSKGKVEA